MLMDMMAKLYDSTERWKDEILEANERWKNEIEGKIDASERRLLLVIEQLRRDVNDMYNDKLSQHEDRIRRLEDHAGFAQAA